MAETNFAALVITAEIIYFPGERAASGARSEPAALLLDALQQNGTAFAIAWHLIEAAEQPVLDQLPGKTNGAREELIAQIDPAGSGRAREHCRAVLRHGGLAGIRHLALGCPERLLAKLSSAGRLRPDEEKELPNGFAPPPDGFEAHAERHSAAGEETRRTLTSYRAEVIRQQYAAERIVRHFRAGGEGKLLVFLPSADLAAGHGVPYYVSQKIQLRQLVFDSAPSRNDAPRLLTTL
ncbi:MAG: ChaN family lipoprotein [Chthoniobacterales bacterium]